MQKIKRLPLLIIIIAIFFTLGVSFAGVARASFFSDLKAMVLGEEDGEVNDDENEDENDSDQDENDDEDENGKEAAKKARENEREALKKSREKEREALKDQAELDEEDENDLDEDDEDEEETEWHWKKEREEKLTELKQQKEEMRLKFKEKFTAERCAKVNEGVQKRTAHFDGASAKHTKVYVNLTNRINKFIARFDAQALDTAAIKTHMTVLQTKIDKFKADYAAYIAKLKETKTLTCGHSEGEFKGTLLEAKELLKTVHSDAADIRTYVRTVILVDIKALKALMPKDADENEDEDETDTNDQDEDENDDDDKPVTNTTTTN